MLCSSRICVGTVIFHTLRTIYHVVQIFVELSSLIILLCYKIHLFDLIALIGRIEKTETWMKRNKLKCNVDKSKSVIFGEEVHCKIQVKPRIKCLCHVIDEKLTFSALFEKPKRIAYCYLQFNQISFALLSTETNEAMVPFLDMKHFGHNVFENFLSGCQDLIDDIVYGKIASQSIPGLCRRIPNSTG